MRQGQEVSESARVRNVSSHVLFEFVDGLIQHRLTSMPLLLTLTRAHVKKVRERRAWREWLQRGRGGGVNKELSDWAMMKVELICDGKEGKLRVGKERGE